MSRWQRVAVSQSIEMTEVSGVGKKNIGKQKACLLNTHCQLVGMPG